MFEISDLLLRRLRTALLYLSMICLGMCTSIPGPTLLDLQRAVNSETDKISIVYIGRSVGYLIGSFFGGIILDRLKKTQLLILLFNVTMSVCTIFIPWCKNLQALISIMGFSGCAMGALDTGLNVWCLDIWDDESSPYFQALHFFFGLGAFFGPIIAAPFLSHQILQEDINGNTSFVQYNFSSIDISQTSPDEYEGSHIIYIYAIIGTISLVVSLLFSLLFLTSVKPHTCTEKLQYKDPKQHFRIITLCCSFLLLCIYAGTEIGFGQMIAVYAVKCNHKFSESLASYFTSLYWGTFTFSRATSIFLAVKYKPFTIIACDAILMFFASLLLVLFGNTYKSMLWIGCAMLGLGLASFYPSTITWVEKHVNVDNKVGSYFVVAASVGEMIAPLTISQYVSHYPEFLLHATLACISACIILIIILRIITSYIGIKKPINAELCLKEELSNLTSDKQLESEVPSLNDKNEPKGRISSNKENTDCVA